MFGASDREAQAGLEPGIGPRSLLSPAVREALSVRSKAARGTEETTDGPCEDAARPRTIAEPGETTVGVGEQPPHFPTLLRTGAPGGENRLVPSSLSGRWRGFKDGRGTQCGSRRRHGNFQPKRENRTMWTRTSRRARSVSAASYSPGGTRD